MYFALQNRDIYEICIFSHTFFVQVISAQEYRLEGLLPVSDTSKQVIVYTGFTLQYNELHEQADWVAYQLTRDEVLGELKRKDHFRSDKQVLSGSASLKDYSRSGYDRGHLAPAADMKWDKDAMNESFLFSNMSPQIKTFNRGIWKRLEAIIRTFAVNNEAIFVVTGPVLHEGLKTIGANKVSVPEYYYKVILDLHGDEIKGIAFLLPQIAEGKDLSLFAVSIDSVEVVTGLNFFDGLTDTIEDSLERECDIDRWEFKPFRVKRKRK